MKFNGIKFVFLSNQLINMKKIEHIGIAVKNIVEANKIYEALFGSGPYKSEKVESEGVETSFFRCGESKIELLEASNPESPIAKFIEKRGEGIHHIAFAVTDILNEMERLKNEGFILLNEEPKKGADNKLVAFLHPKSANGVLVELCQEIENN
jgi:methylmalonyl-CoA/ethylmalonyl-CoA epimerase